MWLNYLNNQGIVHLTKNISNKEIFTVLKSPHINKIAQDHFEFKVYSIKIKVYSYKNFKFLVFLKYLSNKYFFDLDFKYSIVFFNNNSINESKFLNYNNFYLMQYIENDFLLLNYLKLFDLYGEILFKRT